MKFDVQSIATVLTFAGMWGMLQCMKQTAFAAIAIQAARCRVCSANIIRGRLHGVKLQMSPSTCLPVGCNDVYVMRFQSSCPAACDRATTNRIRVNWMSSHDNQPVDGSAGSARAWL